MAVVYSPHTTAAITINENWDQDVLDDMLLYMDRTVPRATPGFKHSEGNSDSHILVSMLGPSVSVIVQSGLLMLGQWQGIFFAEFDGPRTRELWIHVQGDSAHV